MIYEYLDTIPYKLFEKISETGNVRLLTDDESISEESLREIWDNLFQQHIDKNQTPNSKKIFSLSKKIDELLNNYRSVIFACTALEFDYNQEMVDLINNRGFNFQAKTTEEYYSEIARVKRESESYIVKAEYFKQMLPKEPENDAREKKHTVDEVMSSYSAILGYNIGKHNEITYTEFFAHERTVNQKIESLKSITTKSKRNGK